MHIIIFLSAFPFDMVLITRPEPFHLYATLQEVY